MVVGMRWAGDVFGSAEESMRISQERALEAIESRMEMAYILNNQEGVFFIDAGPSRGCAYGCHSAVRWESLRTT